MTANPKAESVRSDTLNPIISRIPHERLSSSAIASVGYSKRRHMLEVEFANGRVYRYLRVTPSVYREFMSADSKARYYDRNIKGYYPSVHVRPRLKDQSD
jgi:KTSC domain-containing protein